MLLTGRCCGLGGLAGLSATASDWGPGAALVIDSARRFATADVEGAEGVLATASVRVCTGK